MWTRLRSWPGGMVRRGRVERDLADEVEFHLRERAEQLFGLTPHDAPTILLAALGLIVSALLAAWLPSRRASGIDPMAALRCE